VNGAPSSMVSPGLWGFVAFFVLAIALYLLMRNMNARMRRMSYRSEELAREAQAEADERKAREQGDVPNGDVPKGDAPEDPEQTGDTNP
jgi:hypothetical protein